MHSIVNACGEVQQNVLLHEPDYPTTGSVLAVVRQGKPKCGVNAVGDGQDSP
ncbi:nucleoside hydrolase-like domain-containing protein [Rubripirellula reticaptiva]|uniref:nucleoside hydrolase-like domain-containing protein n=1 Tax=Rubripirellula reticaptiva TaxID=2528013 RepID=UPI0036F2ED4A